LRFFHTSLPEPGRLVPEPGCLGGFASYILAACLCTGLLYPPLRALSLFSVSVFTLTTQHSHPRRRHNPLSVEVPTAKLRTLPILVDPLARAPKLQNKDNSFFLKDNGNYTVGFLSVPLPKDFKSLVHFYTFCG
jgi:hypothetical protein